MRQEYASLLEPYFRDARFPEITGEKPLVSILTGYYNHAAYLPDFLDSVMGQTYPNWELLLVDDASTEGDAAVVVRECGDPRVKYHRLERNSGLAAARNAGFRRSRGDYIVCFDSDDIMHPWFIQAMMKTMLSPERPDVVTSHLRCFGEETAVWERVVRTERDLTTAQWIGAHALTRRALWEATGGQCTAPELRRGCEDWEFWLHCCEACGPLKVMLVPLPLFLYRRQPQSLSHDTMRTAQYAINRYIYAKHPAIFAKYGTDGQFLANGYGISIWTLLRQKHFLRAAGLFREGFRILPHRLYFRVVFSIILDEAREMYGTQVKPLFRGWIRRLKGSDT